MKKPYSLMTIARLQSSIVNHTKKLKALKKGDLGSVDYTKRLQRAEWQLRTAKMWLQKRTDQRDMSNH